MTSRILTTLLLIGFVAGCAEERPAINRVQPFALKKALFVGEDLQGAQDDPEFYTQATLIDVGYGASQDGLFTSTYAQPMSRIKWQITEDMLIGRIAYERIDGSDGKGLGGPVQDGVIAVAFRITSHFDIINAYNPTTGEQLNIVNENTTDRPWYEREHFRVDWSRNLAVDSYDFDTLSLLGVYGGLIYEPMAFDITDPDDPNAPVFDLENGYFDVTNKAFAKPQIVDLSSFGWGITAFPACFLPADFAGGTGPQASCNPVELTLRHSFRRVENTDYEPQDWDGFRFQAYGAFDVERHGYARNYRMVDDKWHRFISRYNIWDRSHYYQNPEFMLGQVECFTPETTGYGGNPHRDENGDGTEDECAAVTEALGIGGSRCNEFTQKCTLPYQARKTRPMIWHYTELSDPLYFEATRRSTIEWDAAMRLAVRTSQYAECKATGGEDCVERFPVHFGQQDQNDDLVNVIWEMENCKRANVGSDCVSHAQQVVDTRGYDAALLDIAQMEPLVVLCHSPVEHNDPALCGEARLPAGMNSFDCVDAWEDPDSDLAQACDSVNTVRMGDLRYHQVNVIPTPQTPSPWGIYTDSEDPLTGETIAASINVWSWVNDVWSQGLIDKIRYIKGELTAAEITEGEYIQEWVNAAQQTQGGGGVLPKFTRAELDERIKAVAGVRLDKAQLEAIDPQMKADALAIRKELNQVRASSQAPSAFRAKYAARALAASGTEFEAELMTPAVQQLTGVAGLPLTEGTLDHASLLRGANPSFMRDLRHLKENALADRGACILHEAPAPLSVQGLADALEAKFGAFNPQDDPQTQQDRAEKMRRYIATRAHYAVMIHEMGHSVGLRHNFVSSSDAFNYRPQYWQLRTRNGEVTSECEDLVKDGKSCIGPRYFDPVSANERENMIWMFMHSSVMDYAGEPTQDMLGLGAYDFAAPKMFYGDTVAVFADSKYGRGTARGQGINAKLDNFGGILGFQWQTDGDSFHYTQLQNEFDLIDNCQTIDPQDFKPTEWDDDVDGVWHPVLDGRLVAIDGEYSRCEQPKVDYVRWQDMTDGEETFQINGPAYDDDDRMRVPYGFGTDSWADLGNLSVYRHDNGADPYELFDFFISQQEINHIFDNYRRGREGFSVRGAVYRTLGRFNEKMRDGAKGLGLYRNIYIDFALNQNYDARGLWGYIANAFFSENILAAGIAFDHFARQISRPEHGPHFLDRDAGVLRSARDFTGNAGATVLNVPNGATGFYDDIGIGGRPVENQLANDKGEYRSQYTINAGSYYEKMFSSMLLTESVDNFISSSRTDFVDGRYRAVSMADLFPDGYRRWLGNMLTGDDYIKGARVAANDSGTPLTDIQRFPTRPIGWTSWWGSTPRVCFPAEGTTVCGSFGDEDKGDLTAAGISNTAAIDPQVGWEQQKFLIAWTLMYLPENAQQRWLNSMRVWELGVDNDPQFENRIEFHHPSGKVYVAKTEGKETIFGRQVQKGIAARVLEWANTLLVQAYEVEPGPDMDGDGEPEWWIPVIGTDGLPIVKYDENIAAVLDNGGISPRGRPGCDANDNSDCTCEANKACVALQSYVEVPFFLRQAMDAYRFNDLGARGIY